jgi:hypothetical protein
MAKRTTKAQKVQNYKTLRTLIGLDIIILLGILFELAIFGF